MIEILMKFGSEVILVKIVGNSVFFGNTSYGARMANIEGLKLSYDGVVKEFPDLRDDSNWHQEAIDRFKEKISSFKNEEEISNYVITDLKKFGYVPWKINKGGYRTKAIK